MAVDFVDGGKIDHRADRGSRSGAVADPEGIDAGCKLLREGLVDACLNEDTVGADAGLAAIAELRDESAFDGRIEVGIFKDDKGRIAAKLERKPLDAAGSTLHQQ